MVQYCKTVDASCLCFLPLPAPSEPRIGSLSSPSARARVSAIIYLIYLPLWSIWWRFRGRETIFSLRAGRRRGSALGTACYGREWLTSDARGR
jgi:hypothetical protein